MRDIHRKTMSNVETRILTDHELGPIVLRENARARRLIFRCRDGAMECTVPPHTSTGEVARAIEKMRARLALLAQRCRARRDAAMFGPQSRIEADGFTFRCQQADSGKPRVHEDAAGMTFLYPAGLDWHSPQLQQWLTHVVEECLRRRAQRTLPARIAHLAAQRGLHPRKVAIHKTTTRWGSCSSLGNIQLSLYLMLLPTHLRDFIMQHELTHLLEMNHSPRFHALLNQAVDGQEAALEREMKQYHTMLMLQ